MPAPSKPTAPPEPTLGQIVLYRLSADDAAAITRRRKAWQESPPARWGYQAHVGNGVTAGQPCPAVVVGTFGGTRANLAVLLDGTDTFWATSAGPGDTPGTWAWPPRS